MTQTVYEPLAGAENTSWRAKVREEWQQATTGRAWKAIQSLNECLRLQTPPESAVLLAELTETGWIPQGEIRWNIIAYEETKALVRIANSLGAEACQYILRTIPQPAGAPRKGRNDCGGWDPLDHD